MNISIRNKNTFDISVDREELECLYNGLGWTVDQMSGVDNIDKENELIETIKRALYE